MGFRKEGKERCSGELILKGSLMSKLKDFDLAIAAAENTPRGYLTENGNYDSYMSNEAWGAYLSAMDPKHRMQFDDGSGGELKEKNGRPPKMASFASSSRMAYKCSKGIRNFAFEKQLSTVIGGTANLDGYWEGNGKHIFVEAKCREPYSHKSPEIIRQNYKDLYIFLQDQLPDMFSVTMEDIPGTRDMRVAFTCRGKEVIHFDMKQMLCHLLGVANRMMLDRVIDKHILFLYLLYNPAELDLPPKSQEEIMDIYQDTCAAIEGYDFVPIFGCVIDFLRKQKNYGIEDHEVDLLKSSFRFALCDQNTYESYFK